MKIYISGPITNNESCKEDFLNASKLLRTKGYDVVDPMTICEPTMLLFSHQRDEAESRGTWNYYMREAIKDLKRWWSWKRFGSRPSYQEDVYL
mgnify:CR=1 FL=1